MPDPQVVQPTPTTATSNIVAPPASVVLAWDWDYPGNPYAFTLEASIDQGPWVVIAPTLDGSLRQYEAYSLVGAHQYCWRIMTSDSAGNHSTPSNTACHVML
jgi:O-succinylbenzoate synthase